MDYLTSVLYAFGAIQIFQMLPVLIAAQGSHKTIFEVFLDWLWAGIALVLMLLVSISYITVMRWVLEAPNSQPQFMFEVFFNFVWSNNLLCRIQKTFQRSPEFYGVNICRCRCYATSRIKICKLVGSMSIFYALYKMKKRGQLAPFFICVCSILRLVQT